MLFFWMWFIDDMWDVEDRIPLSNEDSSIYESGCQTQNLVLEKRSVLHTVK